MQGCAQAALPHIFLHSLLWLISSIHCFYMTVFYQPFEDRIKNAHTWTAAASTENSQQPVFYSKVTWKAFWFSATASLVWGFLQPSNNPARHIVLIFFCKFANKSWQCISSPTLAHKTLCCMENDTAEATWDGRSQAGLHPPCGFCVFTTACAKGQYNIFNNKTVK